jgi:hypothetical protein
MADLSYKDEITTSERKDEQATVKYTNVCSRLNELSDRLSNQSRTLALSLIAFVWILLAGDSLMATKLAQGFGWQAFGIGGLAVLTLFFDFSQYVFGYRDSKRLLKQMEDTRVMTGTYDYESWYYKAQMHSFTLKLCTLTTAALWFIARMTVYAIQSP